MSVPVHVENLKDLKPTIGFVFADWLQPYSHWAFGDMDVLYGDLSRFLSPWVTGGRDVVSFVAADPVPSSSTREHGTRRVRPGTPQGTWLSHMCIGEATLFAGQLTVFVNSEWSATLFLRVPLWRQVLSDPKKRRLTFFDERAFAAHVLEQEPKRIALVISQLTDQFHSLRGRRLVWHRGRLLLLDGPSDCPRHEAALLHVVGSKYHALQTGSKTSSWAPAEAVDATGSGAAAINAPEGGMLGDTPSFVPSPPPMAIYFPLDVSKSLNLSEATLLGLPEARRLDACLAHAAKAALDEALHSQGIAAASCKISPVLAGRSAAASSQLPPTASPPRLVRHDWSGRGANASVATQYLPIWYALPTLEQFRAVRGACEAKVRSFSSLIPRDKGSDGMAGIFASYTYQDEASYYSQYAKSFFAITRAKAGYDCLRHYEILASGAVPFFIGIDGLRERPLTMLPFPTRSVQALMDQPGVPSQARRAQQNYTLQDSNSPLTQPTALTAHRSPPITSALSRRFTGDRREGYCIGISCRSAAAPLARPIDLRRAAPLRAAAASPQLH